MFTEVLPRLCAIQPDLTGRQLPTYLPTTPYQCYNFAYRECVIYIHDLDRDIPRGEIDFSPRLVSSRLSSVRKGGEAR